MQERSKGIIFLAAIPFVVTFFTIISVYAKDLPDPLNVIAVLLLGFGPLSVMILYWLNRFYFKRKEKGLIQI